MKVFTVENGTVIHGATVAVMELKSAGMKIPAIIVGESGRGRSLGVLPAQLTPEHQREWEEKGACRINAVTVSQTRSGKPKLVESTDESGDALCVLRTHIGYRGGNRHTGDRKAEYWTIEWGERELAQERGVPLKDQYTATEAAQYSKILCPGSLSEDAGFDRHLEFEPFPGEWLVKGEIAQGAAGAMGSGEQGVAVIPAGVVFRTGYTGRLYGGPASHYFIYRDEKLLTATWKEREVSDIF